MPKMNISVPHNLGAGEAQNRIKNLVGDLKKQFGDQIDNVQESWEGNKGNFSFRAMGMSIDGNILVKPDSVSLEGNLPLTAMPFKGTIERTIKDQLSSLLS
ncbi:MAG: polyhydroxyalkanoic acid system family protein [Bacillota bacterium]